MRTTLLSAFAALTLMTASAHAEGEGNGDPFPFRTVGTVTLTGPAASTTAAARLALPSQLRDGTAEAPLLRPSHRHS